MAVRPRPQTTPTTKSPQPKNPSNTSNTIFIILVILIILAVAGYFLYHSDYWPFSPKKQPIEIPPQVAVDTIPTVIKEVIEEVPFKQESYSSVDKGFYIIVGSYHQKSNADYLVKKLQKDVEAEVLHFTELGLYRVSTGKYESIRKAYNDVYSIKDVDGCANAWVLENQ